MVTAELAVALPALVLVLVLGVSAVGVAGQRLRCLDAAQVAARLAARGEADGVVRATATATAPRSASVTVVAAGAQVTVTVRAHVRLPVALGLAAVDVEEHVTAAREDTSGGGP